MPEQCVRCGELLESEPFGEGLCFWCYLDDEDGEPEEDEDEATD